jgi:hypothetical protein
LEYLLDRLDSQSDGRILQLREAVERPDHQGCGPDRNSAVLD